MTLNAKLLPIARTGAHFLLIVPLVFITQRAAAAPAAAPLAVVITTEGITIRNVTPGGDLVLFTAQLEATGGLLRQRTGAKILTDTDRDGVVVFSSPRRVPQRSIWITVDMETGRSSLDAPEGFPVNFGGVPTNLLKKDADGVLGIIDDERKSAEMLIVRPKAGAWRLVAFEGLGNDGDKSANGKLSLASADATAVMGSSPAPKRLKNGDIVAMIDPGRMEAFVTEIGRP